MTGALEVFVVLRAIKEAFEECRVVSEILQDCKLTKMERYAGRTRIRVFIV